VVFEREYIMRYSSAEGIARIEMMSSWCRQVNWGNCGIAWVNCAVLCGNTVLSPALLPVKNGQFNQFSVRYDITQIYSLALRPNVSHCLLIILVSKPRTTTQHSRLDSYGRMISLSQRPVPDNPQHSQQTSMPLVGFEPTISAGEWPQTYALVREATRNGDVHKQAYVTQQIPNDAKFNG